MHIGRFISVLIVNIFLLLSFSILSEYTTMRTRTENIDYTVSTAVDTAIQLSLSAEELYGSADTWDSNVMSKTDQEVLMKVYRDGHWIDSNIYALSKYYDEHNGNFPTSEVNIDSEDVYSWIFGDPTSREVTPEFKEFYNRVGKYINTEMTVKQATANGFNLVNQQLPTLCQTGLKLSSTWNSESADYADVLTTVPKEGKRSEGDSEDSTYYLTPASLGVTYLDVRVLKPIIAAHIEQLMRYRRAGFTNEFGLADGCIPSTIYGLGSRTPINHSVGGDERILNNGVFEIDMNSINVDIDYIVIDAYDSSNYEIMNFLEGAEPYTTTFQNKPSILKNNDIFNEQVDADKRVVARISVSMDLHIPYKSGVMQYFRHLTSNSEDHFDIRELDSSGNNVTSSTNGVKYTYTTYAGIAR